MSLTGVLIKKTYIGAMYRDRKVSGVINIQVMGKNIPIALNRISFIDEEFGVWEKSYHIHEWITNKCLMGQKSYTNYEISIELLKELYRLCSLIQNSVERARSILPIPEGTLNGIYDYNEDYFKDIEYTISVITEALKYQDGARYYYEFSR